MIAIQRVRRHLKLPRETCSQTIELANLTGLFKALLLATVGAAAASWTGLPAAWFTGAMIAVSIAAIARVRVGMSPRLFDAAMLVIGMLLGGGVTPAVIAGVVHWPFSLIILCLSVIACQVTVQAFLTKVGGWDRDTAFYAAIPGGMVYALAGASETNADIRRVAINQLTRLFLLIAIVPTVVTMIEPGQVPPPRVIASPLGLLITVALGVAGGFLFKKLRVPAGLMTGALVASATLHGTGIVVGTLPQPIAIATFVILGAAVGARFVGTTLGYLRQNAFVTLSAFVIVALVSGLFAFLATLFLDIPLDQLIIAFTPAGVDAMTAVALAMNMDSAFVAAHQIGRLMMVVALGPFAARLALRTVAAPAPES